MWYSCEYFAAVLEHSLTHLEHPLQNDDSEQEANISDLSLILHSLRTCECVSACLRGWVRDFVFRFPST